MKEEEFKKNAKEALSNFVKGYEKDKNIVGIIVSGSYVHSTLDKNSDLDVYVILKKSEMQERGNIWINGIEVEYFKEPIKQVKHYLKKEKAGEDSPSTAHMLVNSEILLKRGDYLNILIKEAKAILKKKTPLMSRHDKEYLKYAIDDYKKDLEDVYIRKDYFVFELVAYKLIELCLEGFYKVKRVPKEKYKTLRVYIKNFDKNFDKLFSRAVIENDFSKKFKKIQKLVDYTENLLGGKRSKEWKLKNKCTYKK